MSQVFQACPILPSNPRCPFCPSTKSKGLYIWMTPISASSPSVSDGKQLIKKPQHHYYLYFPKINLFTCKTDALKTNQPIEIISYSAGMWFAQSLERGNVLLSLNSLLMDAWWKVLETMYSAKRWGDRKWLLQRDIAQVSSARNSSPAALAPHMSSSVWKLNCKK